MQRYHATPNGMVPFSQEENLEWEQKELSWSEKETERLAETIRQERNKKLSESDWTQMPDYDSLNKLEWQNYRKALRDIPQQAGFPSAVIWPEKPE